ncbi:MAG: cell envelope integrity protein TolA [Desulfobacteraceae bacterium]|jgi:colicin import membrane protein
MRNDSPSLVVPYIISIIVHSILFGYVIFNPNVKTDVPFDRDQVLDVSMVTMNETQNSAPAASQEGEKEAAPAPKPPPAEEVVEESPPEDAVAIPNESEPEPEEAVPVEPVKPKVKTSLKKRTLKKKAVKKPIEVKKPVEKVAQKEETPKPNPVSEALKRVQKDVQEYEKSGRYNASANGFGSSSGQGAGGGVAERRRRVLIDRYRIEIAELVRENWAFPEQLAGDIQDLSVSLVFFVLPDGKIKDIIYTDRSGNDYLDSSAYKAIQKTKLPPHPDGLIEMAVDVGLRFTPEGVQ